MKRYIKSYITFGICPSCKHYWEDTSVGDAECLKADDMTEEEFEKYFVDEQPGCPFYEEIDYPDEYGYYQQLGLDNL